MSKRLSEDERHRIFAAMRAGQSCTAIARDFRRGKGTISGLAKEIGHDFEQSAEKKARAVKRNYDHAGRLASINAALAKGDQLLAGITKPHEYQTWWIGHGIGLDKRRQEEAQDSQRVGTIRQYIELELSKDHADSADEPAPAADDSTQRDPADRA